MNTEDAEYVRSDGTSKGRTAIVDYLKGIIGAFPDHASRIDSVLISGNAVTVEWNETGTNTEAYVGLTGTIPATGKHFEERIVEVIRFEGEQIASQHECYDLLSLLSQVGWLGAIIGTA